MARLTTPALAAAQQELAPDCILDRQADHQLPGWPGAYALLIHLPCTVSAALRGAGVELAPGWYAYAGSARGPGGTGARIRRHFRPDKPVHWHVDALTLAADRIVALAIENGSECEVVRRLQATGRFMHAIAGFGSSDCRRCRSHLLVWTGA